MASRPPTSRKNSEVAMYWMPITLASVLKLKKRFQLSGAPGTG